MTGELYKTWEALKRDNPWKSIFDRPISGLLRSIWAENSINIHPDDIRIFENRKGGGHFVFDLLPEPYRGNLKEPKLVILSLNPGYISRLNRTLYCMLDRIYQEEYVEALKKNVLLDGENGIVFNEVDNVIGDGYWRSQLAELRKDLGGDDAFYSKMALVQYNPYFSEDYTSWKGDNKLGTQQFSCDLIRRLLYETDALFLVMRARDRWERLIGKEMRSFWNRFMYNNHPRCQKVSCSNLWNKSAERDEDRDQYHKILDVFKNQ